MIALSAVYAEYYIYRHVLQHTCSPSPSIPFDAKQTLNNLIPKVTELAHIPDLANSPPLCTFSCSSAYKVSYLAASTSSYLPLYFINSISSSINNGRTNSLQNLERLTSHWWRSSKSHVHRSTYASTTSTRSGPRSPKRRASPKQRESSPSLRSL